MYPRKQGEEKDVGKMTKMRCMLKYIRDNVGDGMSLKKLELREALLELYNEADSETGPWRLQPKDFEGPDAWHWVAADRIRTMCRHLSQGLHHKSQWAYIMMNMPITEPELLGVLPA